VTRAEEGRSNGERAARVGTIREAVPRVLDVDAIDAGSIE
jgi:hypothetical protein